MTFQIYNQIIGGNQTESEIYANIARENIEASEYDSELVCGADE